MRIPALILTVLMCVNLAGCFAAAAGGVATGGVMASDRRTSGAYIEDESIEWKTLKSLNDALGDKIHVNVTSFNRNVLLTGEVADEAGRVKAEALAKAVENVRSVTNELTLGPASSLSARSSDTYLTSKVKARMVTENRFPPNYVKVVTENGVVYLMGMVTRKEADDAVDIARHTEGVEKVVKVFEYVTTTP